MGILIRGRAPGTILAIDRTGCNLSLYSIFSFSISSSSPQHTLPTAHLGHVWDSVCDTFQRKNQKNPAKRSASNARSIATLNTISDQMNWKEGKHEKRGSSRVPLLRIALPLATVPNRTLVPSDSPPPPLVTVHLPGHHGSDFFII